jgi:hypothetical protein
MLGLSVRVGKLELETFEVLCVKARFAKTCDRYCPQKPGLSNAES